MTSEKLASWQVAGEASPALVSIIGLQGAAIITGLGAWITQRHRSHRETETAKVHSAAEIEVAVIAEWQKLNGALSDRLANVESELAKVRSEHAAEIEKIRRTHSEEIDAMRKHHRDEMRELREQNDELRRQNVGLQRMIAQNSHSTAQLMGEDPVVEKRQGEV